MSVWAAARLGCTAINLVGAEKQEVTILETSGSVGVRGLHTICFASTVVEEFCVCERPTSNYKGSQKAGTHGMRNLPCAMKLRLWMGWGTWPVPWKYTWNIPQTLDASQITGGARPEERCNASKRNVGEAGNSTLSSIWPESTRSTGFIHVPACRAYSEEDSRY